MESFIIQFLCQGHAHETTFFFFPIEQNEFTVFIVPHIDLSISFLIFNDDTVEICESVDEMTEEFARLIGIEVARTFQVKANTIF